MRHEWLEPESPAQADRFRSGCLDTADSLEYEAQLLHASAAELERDAKQYRARADKLANYL